MRGGAPRPIRRASNVASRRRKSRPPADTSYLIRIALHPAAGGRVRGPRCRPPITLIIASGPKKCLQKGYAFIVQDSLASSARQNGLRYVSDQAPGIRRVRRGKRFSYVDPAGRPLSDPKTLARIRSLAVPPAYEDVWICPNPDGHIQATGRDTRNRKQYRYHPRWRELRDETKYARLREFAAALPAIRRRVAADLRRKGLTREKVLAAVVALLEMTAIRVGNDEYARANKSFGLTTLRNHHARVRGSKLTFRFRGKSGIAHELNVLDHRLAKVVRECQDLPDQRLFEYVDPDGTPHAIDSQDVNDYIREISGGDFTAKDFRTWLGTVRCAVALAACAAAETVSDRKRNVVEAIREVSRHLGNTPAVCRKAYVHPEITAAYLERGTLNYVARPSKRSRGLRAEERFVVSLLSRSGKRARAARTEPQPQPRPH
ncbi:MAG: DNA topoisomerase IB [Candidatus Eremiobacteraeota bacterium]|nr:DNA topoisomerase IB [Candidatus Eremiobacteraeota bacterium]